MSLLAVLAALTVASTVSGPEVDPQWSLVWSDEFDTGKIDRSKWNFDVDCWGGGNEERQCYTDSQRNAAIEDGKLVITARKERATGPALPAHLRQRSATPDAQATRPFSSARLSTQGKAAWRYGRMEIRASLPQGQGTWPAIWMLPDANAYGAWAASGEIDILEAVNLGVACAKCPGGTENTILGTLHFGGKWPDNKLASTEVAYPEVLDGFHDYVIEWYPDKMIWKVDGKVFAERNANEWSTTGSTEPGAPFNRPFHLILNLAIGGKLPEGRGIGGVDPANYPKRMEIDWVRVWELKPQLDSGNPVAEQKKE